MQRDMPPCVKCKHLLGIWKCTAYPDGIPQPILEAKNDHTEPYEGDNGIQFETLKEQEEGKQE
jgi:hypothetical protein